MSEFLRPLSAEEFTTGMQLRLDIGKIAVGDVCKIRFETQGLEALDPSSRKYFEAAIAIVDRRQVRQFVGLHYAFLAMQQCGDDSHYYDIFTTTDSLAYADFAGMRLRSYKSDQPDPRWDAAQKELADTNRPTGQ